MWRLKRPVTVLSSFWTKGQLDKPSRVSHGEFAKGRGILSTYIPLFESAADSLIFTNHRWRPFSAGSPAFLRSRISYTGSGVRKHDGDWDWYGRWIANSYVAGEIMQRAVGCVPGKRSRCWSSGRVGVRELSGGWHTHATDENAEGRARLFLLHIRDSDVFPWHEWLCRAPIDRPENQPPPLKRHSWGGVAVKWRTRSPTSADIANV